MNHRVHKQIKLTMVDDDTSPCNNSVFAMFMSYFNLHSCPKAMNTSITSILEVQFRTKHSAASNSKPHGIEMQYTSVAYCSVSIVTGNCTYQERDSLNFAHPVLTGDYLGKSVATYLRYCRHYTNIPPWHT